MGCSELENVVDETLKEISEFAYNYMFGGTISNLKEPTRVPPRGVLIRKAINGFLRIVNKVTGADLVVVKREVLNNVEALKRYRRFFATHRPSYLISVSKFYGILTSLKSEPKTWVNACEMFADETSKRTFVDLIRLAIGFPVYYFSPQFAPKEIKGVNPAGIKIEKYGIRRVGTGKYFPLYSVRDLFKIEVPEDLLEEIFIYKGYQYEAVDVRPKSNSVYLDLGAFAGETIAWYAMEAEDVRAIAVEPGGVVKAMERNLKDDRVGKFLKERKVNVKIVRKIIDEKVKPEELDIIPRKENASFIKSDIEGAERKALKALRSYLHEYKPLMAIAAYHLWDDLIVLPKLILDANPDYKLYLRPSHFKTTFNIFAK